MDVVIGIAGILFGFLIAVYFYRKGKPVHRLAYQLDEVRLVGGGTAAFPKDLEISYRGQGVEQVSTTRVVMWNYGNRTLLGTSIVASDPLRVELASGGAILNVDVVKASREVNACSIGPIEPGSKAVALTFDFLDVNDGLVMDVVHSGYPNRISLKGTLRGAPSSPVDLGSADVFSHVPGRRAGRNNAFAWVMAIAGLILLVPALLPYVPERLLRFLSASVGATEKTIVSGFFAGAGLAQLSMAVYYFWESRRKFPASLLGRKRRPTRSLPSHHGRHGPVQRSSRSHIQR